MSSTHASSSEGTRPTYPQNWPAYNSAQVAEKAKFKILLRDLCANVPTAIPKTGRHPIQLSDALFAAVYKTYSTVSARRFMTDLVEAQGCGLISRVPCYNSIFNIFGNDAVTPILMDLIKRSAEPLASIEDKFAADSTGFSTSRFARWFDHKYHKEVRQQEWVKCHCISGILTNVVPVVVIKEANASDSKQFPALLETLIRNFNVAEIVADKAYSSRKNMELVSAAGGIPFILFRNNAAGRGGGMWTTMFHYFQLHREEFMAHYHLRSNIEATFSMIKRKFGESLRSRTDTAMKNEVICKVICHNIVVIIHAMYEHGIDPVSWPSVLETSPRIHRVL